MNYEDALRLWGASKLGGPGRVDLASVEVKMEFDEGETCCGGLDPECYCSFARSPSADVVITGRTHNVKRYPLRHHISCDDFDFATVLREIVAAGDGTLTLEDGNE